jgi:hypothetical protein
MVINGDDSVKVMVDVSAGITKATTTRKASLCCVISFSSNRTGNVIRLFVKVR